MRRTNAILLVLALALGAFVVGYERLQLVTDDTRERERQLLPTFVRDELAYVSIERQGVTTRLEPERRGGGSTGDGEFRIVAPYVAAADQGRVDEALAKLEWAEPVRVLSRAGSADRARFGLDAPVARVRYRVGTQDHVVAFGGTDPTGAGRFAEADGAFYVVEASVAEAFETAPDHFRRRELGLALDGAATGLVVVRGDDEVVLAARDDGFVMTAPHAATASTGRAHATLGLLRTGAVLRFVSDAPSEAALAPLADVYARVRLTTSRGAHELVVGAPCAGGGRHARLDRGPLVCVADSVVAELALPPLAYVERRACTAEPGSVRSVRLAEGGRELVVTEREGAFSYALGDATGSADTGTVEAWLDGLRRARADSVVSTDGAAFVPRWTLVVARTEGRPDDSIAFAEGPDGALLGRRGSDSAVLRFPASLRDLLVVSTRAVRSRELLALDVSAFSDLVVERADGRERCTAARDGEPEVVEPIRVRADAERVADLVARLATLEAVRFVADAPAPAHGLGPGALRLAFTFGHDAASRATHRLVVGARAGEDGRYAMLDDATDVFVLREATAALAEAPLASRQELVSETLAIDALTLREGGRQVTARRDGDRYLDAERALDANLARLAFESVSALRAEAVLPYSTTLASAGLVRPAGSARVVREAASPEPREYELAWSAPYEHDGASYVNVRRLDQPVIHRLPATSLDAFRSLLRAQP